MAMNLAALQELETTEVEFPDPDSEDGVQMIKLSSLVTADVAEARHKVKRGTVDKDEEELYLAFLSVKKNDDSVEWNEFRMINMKFRLRFISALFKLNGMDEIFRTVGGGSQIESY